MNSDQSQNLQNGLLPNKGTGLLTEDSVTNDGYDTAEEREQHHLLRDIRCELSILASVLCKSLTNKAALSEVGFNNSYRGVIGRVTSWCPWSDIN